MPFNPAQAFVTESLKLGVSQLLQNDQKSDDLEVSEKSHNQWWHLVEIYTGCDLIYSSDRRSAIFGLWQEQIWNDLLSELDFHFHID